MSSRTVSVVLTAQVQNYLTNMKAAEQRTLEVERASRTATEQFRRHTEAVQRLGVGMLAVGATAAAGLAIAVKAASDFGAKMAQLQALSHASAATMRQLSDAAMSVGTAYGFSATQVADAQIELVKAGVSVQAQLGGALKGALTLAAAGQIDVAQATEISTVAMTQFGLSAAQVPHLADLLSAGADKALGSVGDLGEALKNGGLQAHNMGMSIDDTVGTLSAFANAGILGAEAGTQLRSMFLRLQNPTTASKAAMAEYGIAINDTSGKFVGITKFADELHTKLDGLSQAQRNQALATMFGSHAIVGATVLYQDGGAAAEKAGTSIGDWIRNVNDSGFAAAQAAGKMNSLQGDTQKLAAAFQTDLIKAGSGANDALRTLTQDATGLLTVFGQIPAPVQDVVVVGTALTAGVGLLGGAFLVAVPKVVAFKGAMAELGLTVKGVASTAGVAGAAVIGLTALMSGMSAAGTQGVATTKQVADAADTLQNRFKSINKLFDGNALVGSGIKNAFDQEMNGEAANSKGLDGLLFNISHAGDVYKQHEGSFAALGSQLSGLSKIDYRQSAAGFGKLVGLVGAAGNATKQMSLVKLLGPDYQQSLTGIAKGLGVAATQTNLLAIASGRGALGQQALAYQTAQAAASASKQADTLAALAGQASSATTNIDGLQKTIEGFGSAQLDARGATRAMYQAIDDATAAVRKNGRTLDVTTQAGRDNQAALDGIASAADAAASKTLKQTGSASKAADQMRTGRAAYIKAAEAMGIGASQAGKLADQIGLIPSNIVLAVKGTDLDPAVIKIKRIKDAMNNLDGTIANVEVAVQVAGGSSASASIIGRQLQLQGLAAGGPIDGPGPRGVDSVPAMLAPGEHVLTTRDVDRLGGQGGVYRFRSALASGAVQPFAAGGASEQLRQAREDFVSAQRRATSPIDPLSYVDDLRQMSRDTAYSSRSRSRFDAAANRYESALVKFTAASEKATTRLNDLRQSATQLRDAAAAAVTGGYRASSAGSVATASGWINRDGIRLRSYSTGTTASSLASYYMQGAASAHRFVADLAALRRRGVAEGLLVEIEGYGVEQGQPIAAALLAGSASQIAQVNRGYRGIAGAGAAAGALLADDAYGPQIKAAKRNADRITEQLRSDGEKLRRLIASAFGLKGYATGTTSAAAGIRWVGEDGPELVGFRGGEAVLNRSDSRRWVRGSAGSATGGGQPITVQAPPYPDTITVQDLQGFRATMRVVAHQVVSQRNDEIAVRLMGATA